MEQLRFKDDSGNHYPEWNKNKISEVGFLKTSSIDKLIHQNEEVLNLVNYMDVYKQKEVSNKTVKNMPLTSANKNQISQNNLKKGDVLFTPSSETKRDIGHTLSIKEDIENAVYSYHLMRFRPNIEFDPNFLNYVFKTKKSYFQLSQFAQGLTRYTLSIKNLNKLEFNYPNSIKEQEKIGNYFSNLDKIINNKSRQLDLLELYKKDMLYKIFNQKIRFKDDNGNDYPEWSEEKVEKYILIFPKTKNPASLGSDKGKFRFFTSSIDKEQYIDESLFNGDYIIIGDGGVANFIHYIGEFNVSDHCWVANFRNMNNGFVKNYFEYKKKYINDQLFQGTGLKNLSRKLFLNFKIPFCKIDEQDKIANTFFKIDSDLLNLRDSLKSMNNLKKDMLEKMF